MAQRQSQTIGQKQKQKQTATIQQMLQSTLMELPMVELQTKINTEMINNPALEAIPQGEEDGANDAYDESSPDDTYADEGDRQDDERQSIDDVLSDMSADDADLPIYCGGERDVSGESAETDIKQDVSFLDKLHEQMADTYLDATQRSIMEYLIGSLDDDGLLRKKTDILVDELAVYVGINVSAEEVEKMIAVLQTFDPAGIGARTLKECLYLQVKRRKNSRMTSRMEMVIAVYYDEFIQNRWESISKSMLLSPEQTAALRAELRKLNPKPGIAINETVGKSTQRIIPDFTVETRDDGTLSLTINNGEIPTLQISQSFADMVDDYHKNKKTMNKASKEALLYMERQIWAAKSFIEAVKSRNNTLAVIMDVIIRRQQQFFLDGDETGLRPMILQDIADTTGFALSTVSRACKNKYVSTRWGIYPLKFFFKDAFITKDGEELSKREIEAAIREVVDSEDKCHPLSDASISRILEKKGFPITRRTVTKYREYLSIPEARMRK